LPYFYKINLYSENRLAMNSDIKKNFILLWKKYFGEAELPIAFFYTGDEGGAEPAEKPKDWNCIICELSKVRKGRSLYFNGGSLGCGGSRRYLGYTDKMRPDRTKWHIHSVWCGMQFGCTLSFS
jgi:uncharacterized protein (DUF169 family)